VGRENDVRLGLLRRGCVHVAAVAFDSELIRLVSEADEFGMKNIANRGFVPGDRFNVYEVTGESDDIHGNENNARGDAQSFGSKIQPRPRRRDVACNVSPRQSYGLLF
jgi:hypothetical protein